MLLVGKNLKTKVNPHGKEWKRIYSIMLKDIMKAVDFPADITGALQKHLERPKASSCSDPHLFKVLKRYNPHSDSVFLEEIQEGEQFVLQKDRLFKKGKKRRTSYRMYGNKNQKGLFGERTCRSRKNS